MDLKLSSDPFESYILFQTKVVKEYKKMLDEFNIIKLDANDTIHKKQVEIRKLLTQILKDKGVEI